MTITWTDCGDQGR